jgi:hypothetical protein
MPLGVNQIFAADAPRSAGSRIGHRIGMAATASVYRLEQHRPGARSAAFGVDSVYRSGAPRSMKMGTIRSLSRYDGPSEHSKARAELAPA